MSVDLKADKLEKPINDPVMHARKCSALMLHRKEILGDFTLSLDTLSDIHWLLLLRFAKASKRFYRP